jgi:uncharacterized protein YeaO (DUF488 family)
MTDTLQKFDIRLKRAYEPASPGDGTRILVDRLWPRGVRKAHAAIDRWVKEIAPSTELRRWFGHDRHRWTGFQRRYPAELSHQPSFWTSSAPVHGMDLVHAGRDESHNEAGVLHRPHG